MSDIEILFRIITLPPRSSYLTAVQYDLSIEVPQTNYNFITLIVKLLSAFNVEKPASIFTVSAMTSYFVSAYHKSTNNSIEDAATGNVAAFKNERIETMRSFY